MVLSDSDSPLHTVEDTVLWLSDMRTFSKMEVTVLKNTLLAADVIEPDLMLTVAEIICDQILPKVTFSRVDTLWETEAQSLLRSFLQHESLTGAALEDVMGNWLDLIVEEATGRSNPGSWLDGRLSQKVYSAFVSFGMAKKVCSTAMVGTVWRVSSALFGEFSQANITTRLCRNPNAPLPLLAHDFQKGHYAYLDFEKRLRNAYPDLDDLPLDILTEVAANDQYPEEWFVNQSRIPVELRWLAPGIPVPVEEVTDVA